MGPKHHDFQLIQTQLTLARWYLDAAASAAAEAIHLHLQQAQNMYDISVRAMSQLRLDEQQRNLIEQELAALRVRLQSGECEE